jgi:hypothetical protein
LRGAAFVAVTTMTGASTCGGSLARTNRCGVRQPRRRQQRQHGPPTPDRAREGADSHDLAGVNILLQDRQNQHPGVLQAVV